MRCWSASKSRKVRSILPQREWLADVLLEASERVQVVVTSHSADLLDRDTIPLESILAVVSKDGETRLARSTIRAGPCFGTICSPLVSCFAWTS